MSRIHDALKRAEQERASAAGRHVEPSFAEPFFDQPKLRNPELRNEVQRENMPAMQPTGAAARPAMSPGMTYESLLAYCPQSKWSPDPLTMLFFRSTQR